MPTVISDMKTPFRPRRVRPLLAGLLFAAGAAPALAWVYPEHRDIAVIAVDTLDAQRRADFDRLWAEARRGHEQRLCARPAETDQGLAPACIDWAAFPAIAGDHSCSSRDMLDNVLKTDWILAVADVAAQLKVDLARVTVQASPGQSGAAGGNLFGSLQRRMEDDAVRAQRQNALRVSDTRLTRADPQYVSRAGSNNAHFLQARPRTNMTAAEYAEMTLGTGAELSAIGVYGVFHLSALQKATRLAREPLTPAERQALTLSMLADEAFALHFLEDTFAAGHVAGTWGDASQRKGTHDFYNANGIEVFAWKGSSESMVLMGDAHMRPEDAQRAAVAVRASLEQVLDHAAGRARQVNLPYAPTASTAPAAFDVCRNNNLVAAAEGLRPTPEAYALGAEVLLPTPVPGLGPGLGSMPRFRAEVGPFVGMAGSVDVRALSGGFLDGQDSTGLMAGGELSVRAGLGLDGVIGDAGDGLIFASLGVRGDSASSSKFSNASGVPQAGSLTAAIPSRIGLSTRIRMPFYLIPGDLLLLAPLYLVAPQTYANMAVTASNGGLIPWQLGWATRFGRFQFVLGRELGVTFYGLPGNDSLLAPAATPGGSPRLVDYKSNYFDLPILEYRPYRAFDTSQSSAVLVQLFAGADVPYGAKVTSPPGAPGVDLRTVWSLGLRVIFDWRHYF